jgi:hypothetical protein
VGGLSWGGVPQNAGESFKVPLRPNVAGCKVTARGSEDGVRCSRHGDRWLPSGGHSSKEWCLG